MGLFDNAVPGGNITKPLLIALGALLVGKMLSGRSAEQPDQASAPADPTPAGTTASDGGLLGGLGGLLDKLKDAGHGNVADSWVGTGQNQSINANDLGAALGPQVIREIAQRTGMDEGGTAQAAVHGFARHRRQADAERSGTTAASGGIRVQQLTRR